MVKDRLFSLTAFTAAGAVEGLLYAPIVKKLLHDGVNTTAVNEAKLLLYKGRN